MPSYRRALFYLLLLRGALSLDLDMELRFRGDVRAITFATDGVDTPIADQGAVLFCQSIMQQGSPMCTDGEISELKAQIIAVIVSANENLWKNDVLRSVLSSRKVTGGRGETHELTSAITASEGLFLYDMIVRNRMTRTLEVGMAYGISTLYMLQAHADADAGDEARERRRHVAVDPFQSTQWHGIGMLHVLRAGLQNALHLREIPSYEALPLAVSAGETYQMILIDGMHTFDYTLVDFFYADMLLENMGVLVFDDAQMPSVQAVMSFVESNRAYKRVEPPGLRSSRFAVYQKLAKDDREWDFHRQF